MLVSANQYFRTQRGNPGPDAWYSGQSVHVSGFCLYLPAAHGLHPIPSCTVYPLLQTHDAADMDPCIDELCSGQLEHALKAFHSWKLRSTLVDVT